jgi:hypothetical protein
MRGLNFNTMVEPQKVKLKVIEPTVMTEDLSTKGILSFYRSRIKGKVEEHNFVPCPGRKELKSDLEMARALETSKTWRSVGLEERRKIHQRLKHVDACLSYDQERFWEVKPTKPKK